MSLIPRRHALALCAALPWALSSPASHAQRTLGGVQYPASITMGDKLLMLNGAGIRYKAMFQVYAIGLYMEDTAKTSEAVQQIKGFKRVTSTMLRDIQATELGNLFTKGILDNNPSNVTTQLLPSIYRMSEVFSRVKVLRAGDQYMADRIPGKGMVLTVKGEAQHEPFEEVFFDALLNIWMGPKPPDRKLQQALLGSDPYAPKDQNNS